jgi:hypothetical protein
MHTSYVIQWKNKVNGRAGKGTRQFNRTEAGQLVEELNEEYPQILHEVVPWQGLPAEPAENPEPPMEAESATSPGPDENQEDEATANTHSLSG